MTDMLDGDSPAPREGGLSVPARLLLGGTAAMMVARRAGAVVGARPGHLHGHAVGRHRLVLLIGTLDP